MKPYSFNTGNILGHTLRFKLKEICPKIALQYEVYSKPFEEKHIISEDKEHLYYRLEIESFHPPTIKCFLKYFKEQNKVKEQDKVEQWLKQYWEEDKTLSFGLLEYIYNEYTDMLDGYSKRYISRATPFFNNIVFLDYLEEQSDNVMKDIDLIYLDYCDKNRKIKLAADSLWTQRYEKQKLELGYKY